VSAVLAPLDPEPASGLHSRSSLAVKSWRQALFPSGSPASRREVELLGEWLSSVLAENLELHESPLDVCTNAQHWFSVAFNELIRQVAVDCAERGRLFAVIWKRNQDLLAKLVQVQREEREYILSCHKDRIQFLRADLEFCQSRLATTTAAYDDEQARWVASHERDISKFDSLQQKIDDQIAERKTLLAELREIRARLGLPDDQNDETRCISDQPAPSCTSQALVRRCQTIRWAMRAGDCPLADVSAEMANVTHFLDRAQRNSTDIRDRFERFFLVLPPDAQPTARQPQWLLAAISYIYSHYMVQLASSNTDRAILKRPFADVVYELLLGIYGSRIRTEQVMFDLLYTLKLMLEVEMARFRQFGRFIGLFDPLPIQTFHYYLYTLAMMNRAHAGPLFPELASSEQMISGIPTPAACAAGQTIFERFATGRALKFYTERLNKIAGDGMMRFGGKNLAEFDQVLDYLLSAYVDECVKLDEELKEQIAALPGREIKTFSQFLAIVQVFRQKPAPGDEGKMMRELLAEERIGAGSMRSTYRSCLKSSTSYQTRAQTMYLRSCTWSWQVTHLSTKN
jgi:hypothetical protein